MRDDAEPPVRVEYPVIITVGIESGDKRREVHTELLTKTGGVLLPQETWAQVLGAVGLTLAESEQEDSSDIIVILPQINDVKDLRETLSNLDWGLGCLAGVDEEQSLGEDQEYLSNIWGTRMLIVEALMSRYTSGDTEIDKSNQRLNQLKLVPDSNLGNEFRLSLQLNYLEGKPLAGENISDAEDLLNTCENILHELLKYIKLGVIHRDIKPGNIITGSNGGLYIIDQGLTTPLNYPEFMNPGTPPYMSDFGNKSLIGSDIRATFFTLIHIFNDFIERQIATEAVTRQLEGETVGNGKNSHGSPPERPTVDTILERFQRSAKIHFGIDDRNECDDDYEVSRYQNLPGRITAVTEDLLTVPYRAASSDPTEIKNEGKYQPLLYALLVFIEALRDKPSEEHNAKEVTPYQLAENLYKHAMSWQGYTVAEIIEKLEKYLKTGSGERMALLLSWA